MDVAPVVAALYSLDMIEIESICLIDQITGERACLIVQALKNEKALAVSLGYLSQTVDDLSCIATTELLVAIVVPQSLFSQRSNIWGLPL